MAFVVERIRFVLNVVQRDSEAEQSGQLKENEEKERRVWDKSQFWEAPLLVLWYLSFLPVAKEKLPVSIYFFCFGLIPAPDSVFTCCFPLYEVWCFFFLYLSNKPILVWSLRNKGTGKNNENFSSSNMYGEQKKVKTINKTHTQKIIDCLGENSKLERICDVFSVFCFEWLWSGAS